MKIYLRELELKDLKQYLYWNNPKMEFHNFNGPYFKRKTGEELIEYIDKLEKRLIN